MLSGPLFWFLMGLLFALVAAGARLWVQDLGLAMRWWKWLLAALWYALVVVTVAAPMTLAGEKEPGAGLRLALLLAVITVIFGVALVRVMRSGRQQSST